MRPRIRRSRLLGLRAVPITTRSFGARFAICVCVWAWVGGLGGVMLVRVWLWGVGMGDGWDGCVGGCGNG